MVVIQSEGKKVNHLMVRMRVGGAYMHGLMTEGETLVCSQVN